MLELGDDSGPDFGGYVRNHFRHILIRTTQAGEVRVVI